MANPARRKGTAGENGVIDYLRRRGWPYAERRALGGSKDRGDVAGIAGVVLEVKNCAKWQPAAWLAEAAAEQANDNAVLSAVVVKKRGTTDAGQWYALLTFRQLCDLLAAAGYRGQHHEGDAA